MVGLVGLNQEVSGKMMDFVFNVMDVVLKMMYFVFKMMDFGRMMARLLPRCGCDLVLIEAFRTDFGLYFH